MKFFKTLSPILLSIIILASCATIISTPKQKVNITSEPSGAKIFVNGKNTGSVTPAEIKITRRVKDTPTSTKQTQSYVLKKDGFNNQSFVANSKFGLAQSAGNVFTFFAGFIIDGATGSNRVYPKKHHFTLSKGSSSDLLIDREAEKEIAIVTEKPVVEKPKAKTEPVAKVSPPKTIVKTKPIATKSSLPITKNENSGTTSTASKENPTPSKPKETAVAEKEVSDKIINDGKYTKIDFEANTNKTIKGDFPTQEYYEGDYIIPIGTIQGIEIGYQLEIDSEWNLDGTSHSDRDITLVVRNKTGKKIVFNNSMDKIAEVKFTGESVEFDIDADGKFYKEKMGSKCPFYAFALDKENGKYVMEPNEFYEWDYTIYQDAETMVGGMFNRRFKTLWAKSYVPINHKGQYSTTKLIAYPEINLSKFPKEVANQFSTQQISISGKKIEITPAIRGLSQKTALKTEGIYTVALENENIKVLYYINPSPKLNKDNGYLEYDMKVKIENTSGEKIINKWKRGRIGWLRFYNCNSMPLHIAEYNKGWEPDFNFTAGKSVEYERKLKMTCFSGELWDEKKSYANRNLETNHPIVLRNIEIVNRLMASKDELSPKNEDGKTLVHVYFKLADMTDINPNYDPTKNDPSDLGGLMEEKQNRMFLTKFNKFSNDGNFKLYLNETANVSTSIIVKNSYTFEMPQGGVYDFFVSGSKKITSQKLVKAKEKQNTFSVRYSQINIETGKEAFYLKIYKSSLEKVTKQEYYDFIQKQPYSSTNNFFKVNSNSITSTKNPKIAARTNQKSTTKQSGPSNTTATKLPKGAIVILDEEFSDNSFGWKEVNIKASKYNVSEGMYAMKEGLLSSRSPIHSIPGFNSRSDNYIIEASLSFLDNKQVHMKGISFGFSSDSSICYSFSIMRTNTFNKNNKVVIKNLVSISPDFGLNVKLLSQLPIYKGTPSSFNDRTNTLKIVKENDVTKFYLNDQFLAESGNFVFNSSLFRFNSNASSSGVNWIKITKTGTSKEVSYKSNTRDLAYKEIKANEIESTNTSKISKTLASNEKKKKIKNATENESAVNTKYRRSALYTLMIFDPTATHNKTIRDAFGNLDVPTKFNDHNVGPYNILSLTNIKQQEKQITNFLTKNNIAKKMVAKWFNRDSEGKFNMELIKTRGLYDASVIDQAIASNMARGNAMLADAGEELINKTFIVVNDLKFIDLSTEDPSARKNIDDISIDLKGYVIRTNSYLYQLEWDEETQANFYYNYWTDENNFDPAKVEAFNKANGYKLKFIGTQAAWAKVTSTTLTDNTDEDLIQMATTKAIDKAIGKLERKFEAFRTKTPLVSTEPLAAKIGTKEGLEGGDKFEVLETKQDPNTGKITYKRVAVIKVDGKNIWDNSYTPDEMKQLEKDGKLPKLQHTIFKGSGNFYPGQLIKQIN